MAFPWVVGYGLMRRIERRRRVLVVVLDDHGLDLIVIVRVNCEVQNLVLRILVRPR